MDGSRMQEYYQYMCQYWYYAWFGIHLTMPTNQSG